MLRGLFALAWIGLGCTTPCEELRPTIVLRLTVTHPEPVDAIRIYLSYDDQRRARTFEVGSALADGVTSLVLHPEPAPQVPYEALIRVVALGADGSELAEGSASRALSADGCNEVTLLISAETLTDAGVDAGVPEDAGPRDTGFVRDVGVLDAGPHDGAQPPVKTIAGPDHLALGFEHACAIVMGALYCWGSNALFQMGTAAVNDNAEAPTLIDPMSVWEHVEAGGHHTCAIRDGGELLCWGSNGSGQLGRGVMGQIGAMAIVEGDLVWTDLACGTAHTCAIRVDGTLWCWGDNGSGQLGRTTTPQTTSIPGQVVLPDGSRNALWSDVATGHENSCGINRGDLFCWGRDDHGQLANGVGRMDSNAPSLIGPPQPIQIGVGDDFVCATSTAGVSCWGDGNHGRNGAGDGTDREAPTPVSQERGMLGAGDAHACLASSTDGSLFCWGNGRLGTLVESANENILAPTQLVSAGAGWSFVEGGKQFTCAVHMNGNLSCWGLNLKGQLGLGDSVERVIPTEVRFP